jgi:septum site-determining protein MinC
MSSLARPTAASFQVPAPGPAGEGSPITLKGTARGLEILVTGAPSTDEIADRLTALLAEAPSFFAGNKARVAIEHPLPRGALSRLEEVATRFDLTITEVGPHLKRTGRGTQTETEAVTTAQAQAENPATPTPRLAQGSMPNDDEADIVDVDLDELVDDLAATTAIDTMRFDLPIDPATEAAEVAAEMAAPGPRIVVGPIRSGVSLEYPGHVVIMGDINPGAEVSARGNIVVLGRLRGVAHAGVGSESGFILALCLEPQQLRVGRLVARAGADDGPGDGVEIAYVTGKTIVVERYQGRLPSGLAASM